MKVRVRLGEREVEVEGSKEEVSEFFSNIPDIFSKLSDLKGNAAVIQSRPQQLPELTFGKGESLPLAILKLFSSGGGSSQES